jgi:hypothetical protein
MHALPALCEAANLGRDLQTHSPEVQILERAEVLEAAGERRNAVVADLVHAAERRGQSEEGGGGSTYARAHIRPYTKRPTRTRLPALNRRDA